MSELFVYYGKNNTKYPAAECTCMNCGKVFLKGLRWIERTPLHMCSRQCGFEYKAKQCKAERQKQLESWKAEQHRCATCGKVMTEFYGSGKFCSRACANTKEHSDETKKKISSSCAKFYADIDITKHADCLPLIQTHSARQQYAVDPKLCIICGSEIPYELRRRTTCNIECYKALAALNAKKNSLGGLTDGCGNYSKHGRYKGIKCDSIYELVFLIYCLDNNISISRNKKYFSYEFEGKSRKYYPDFYLPDSNTFIELKGYKDAKVDLKLQAVVDSGNNINILYKQDLLPYFEYVGKTYDKKFNPDYNNLEELYD